MCCCLLGCRVGLNFNAGVGIGYLWCMSTQIPISRTLYCIFHLYSKCTHNNFFFFLQQFMKPLPSHRPRISFLAFSPAKSTYTWYRSHLQRTRHCVLSVLRSSVSSKNQKSPTKLIHSMMQQQNLLKAETTSAAIVGVAGGEYKVAEPSASEVAYFADTEGISKCHIAHISIAQCSADSFFSLNLH